MGPDSATCAIILVVALSVGRGLAYSRQHRFTLPGPSLGIQELSRQDGSIFEVLRQETPLIEASSAEWSDADVAGVASWLQETDDDSNSTGGILTDIEGGLWDGKGESSPASFTQLDFSPLDESALALYHRVFRESVQGTAKPSFNYIRTHSALRSLAVTNLIIGSLLPELDKKRAFIRKIEKAVKKTTPKDIIQEEAEVKEVVKVVTQLSGISPGRIRNDRNVMAAIYHIISNVREGKRNGFAGLFESLASESIFTIAHSLLHTGASLGFSFQPMLSSGLRLVQGCVRMAMKIQSLAGPALLLPGGVVGTVLRHFIRAFNLIFFPPLLAVTGGLAGAMGVACLLGVPTLFSELYNFVSSRVLKGVSAVYKHTQLFRLRRDPHGARVLKSAFSGKFVSMLTQLWQLDSVGVETLENTCEGIFRRLETFSTRSKDTLNFITWMAFRDYIAELLLMVYNTARLSLEAQIKQSENPSIETLRAAFAEVDLQDSLVANIVVKPRLERDVHNFTSGVVATFFVLRKLHQWRPWSVEKVPVVGATSAVAVPKNQQPAKQQDEDVSLVTQRLEAFAEVEMPPELMMAAPELKVVEDKSVTSPEATLLGTYAAKRDLLMMSLLRRSLQKIISAFNSIFGRLEKMVQATVGRDRVQTCKLADRKLCFNADEATKARFAALQFIIAAHLGVSMGREEKLAESPQELKNDFMSFVKDAAWFRYRPRTLRVFRRKPQWGLNILIDHLFPQRKEDAKKEDPVSEEHLATIDLAVTSNQLAASEALKKLFKLTRLQCISNGSLLVLTTDLGGTKVFKPEPPIDQETQRKLCTPEHEFVKFNAWYMQKDVGGHLLAPGLADIDGFMIDSGVVLRENYTDQSAGYLIEAALWSKGIPRIDALKAADLLVATKRMLYSNSSWEEFFNDWSPTDLDYVQQNLLSGMHLEKAKYVDEERKALYSLDFSADGFLELFQVMLWDEYATRRERSKVASVSCHIQSSADSAAPPQPARKNFQRPSISDAFSHEEGTGDPLFAEWCEELYSRASNRPDERGSARLGAQDAGIIQCSLLRFLGKRQKGEPTEKEKSAVFKYLHHVTELLRKAKKTNRYSWKKYLNAKPSRRGEDREQADSVGAAIKRSLLTLKKRASRGARRMAHKITSEAAKTFFGIRVFNILRGPEFLRTLQLAAAEAFADQALFPSKLLIHPTTLAAFTRIRTLMKFEVLPIMNRPEGAEVITQMKMMPTPSPAVTSYLSLLYIASSAPSYVSSNMPTLFSRFVSVLDRPREESRGEYFITRRSLAYLEQAGMKLILKAGDAVALLEKSSIEPPVELRVHRTLGLLSNISPASLPLAAAGRTLHHPRLGRASLFLFCSLAIPALANPEHEKRREAGLKQIKELRELLTTSEYPLYFQINTEATSTDLVFHDLESLISAAQSVQPRSDSSEQTELTAAFLLHAPLMKALEIMGLVTEPVGNESVTSPLQCTPEDKSSGISYTIPINGSSRLRMITSMLIQLGDAEDVVERLEASNMAAVSTQGGSTKSSATAATASSEELTQSSEDERSSASFDEVSKTQTPQTAEQTDSYASTSPTGDETSTLELTASSEQWADPTRPDVNTTPSGDSSTLAGVESKGPKGNYGVDRALEMAIKADQESLRNAKATVQHLTQQVSLFEAHSSAFASVFHTLISVAQLPTRLYGTVSSRFINHLAVAVLGEPLKQKRRFALKLERLKRRRLRRMQALRRPVRRGREKYAAPEASSENVSFSAAFLPFSVKDALSDIRNKWKNLLNTDYLAVRSAACKQDADLWLKDELEENERASADEADKAQSVEAATEQFRKTHQSRQQLCVHPVWLELRSRISVEQDMLEAERLFAYFVRMGMENVKLVQQSADQALLDHLWDQLAGMGVVGPKASPAASASVRRRLREAVERVSKKRPFMAVEPVRELVTGALEHLLQTPNMEKEGLREMLEQLQIGAVERAAAFLLSKAAGVEQDAAEQAVKNLVQVTSEAATPGSTPEESLRVSNLQAWLIQMYFIADPLLLLSRPSIFKPAVVLIEILNKTAHPRSPVYTIWRKALKSIRQLAIASLELLLRLPRAYVRYPQKSE
ncbi:hypothetical protein, conserved [Eimeria brunetti]|uniref:Uncharacterized protein n=1 Tax=Eimeria brunetti TaxID=51314 RepID=U6L9C4_9EIME|nr:hypothetical protein, conserved [Eimeria brunetti]